VLYQFIISNREKLIVLCRQKVAERQNSEISATTRNGVPAFLQQLTEILRAEDVAPIRAEAESNNAPAASNMQDAASLHGAELLRLGFTIDHVVHEYGDICQSVTELAVEEGVAISADEFRTLNRCLDNAIAFAVAAFGSARETWIRDRAGDLALHLENFMWDQARLIDNAAQAFAAIRTGGVGLNGATGQLLAHSLTELRYLSERTLPRLRRASYLGTEARQQVALGPTPQSIRSSVS
jgi:hypothetical protein